jgi:ABC-type branched-subunit amino acid transport system substrate-binding protein
MRPRHVRRFEFQISNLKYQRRWICLLIFEICYLFFVSSCASTRPVVKFGLVAPFEGRYRPLGYDAIYAARLAVRERNAAGGVGGYRVELVAYDDGGDARAAIERARQLVLDRQVVAAIGHYRVNTSRAAWDVYGREGLPLIAPVIPADSLPDSPCAGCKLTAAFRTGSAGQPPALTGQDDVFAGGVATGTVLMTGAPWPQDVPGAEPFITRYRAISGGVEPGPYAWATYRAVQILFEAMSSVPGEPTRPQVGAQLAARFDGQGALPGVMTFVYRVEGPGRPMLQR